MAQAPFSLLVKVSAIALFQVFFVTAVGFFIKYFNILDRDKVRAVSKFISNVLYPCLMFSEILMIWDLTQWQLWLPLLLLNVGMCVLSFIIMWIISCFYKMKTCARNLIICLLSFPNTGALPLIFIGALEEAFNLEAEKQGEGIMSKDTFEKAVGFIMLNACIQTLLRWSIGYDLMRKPANPNEIQEKKENEKKDTGSELMVRLQEIINPTLLASLVAIVIGSIPIAKGLFYVKGGDAPLYSTVFKTMLLIGSNGKSIMTIQLGCNLAMIFDSKSNEEDEEEEQLHSIKIKNLFY